jgi:hypothetical protein
MAMPKKGTRKIVVGGNTYNYVIKPEYFGNDSSCGGRLTVEFPDNRYESIKIEEAITPSMVEAFIWSINKPA